MAQEEGEKQGLTKEEMNKLEKELFIKLSKENQRELSLLDKKDLTSEIYELIEKKLSDISDPLEDFEGYQKLLDKFPIKRLNILDYRALVDNLYEKISNSR